MKLVKKSTQLALCAALLFSAVPSQAMDNNQNASGGIWSSIKNKAVTQIQRAKKVYTAPSQAVGYIVRRSVQIVPNRLRAAAQNVGNRLDTAALMRLSCVSTPILFLFLSRACFVWVSSLLEKRGANAINKLNQTPDHTTEKIKQAKENANSLPSKIHPLNIELQKLDATMQNQLRALETALDIRKHADAKRALNEGPRLEEQLANLLASNQVRHDIEEQKWISYKKNYSNLLTGKNS